ncbi:MAG: EamA family transporter [bacterium]
MLWVILGISSHFFWAILNLGDKYVLSKRVNNPYVYLVWLTLVGILSVVLIPFIDFHIPQNPMVMLLIIVGGIMYFFGGLPYVKAMQMEEPSRINIWWNLIPIFSFFIGWIFLDESFTGAQSVAFIVLLIGAIIASIRSKGNKFVFSKAVWLMIIACIAYSFYGVTFHYITRFISFAVGFVWIHLVMLACCFTMFLIKKFRSDFLAETKKAGAGLFLIVFVIAILDHLGIFFNQWALSLNNTALVFSLEGFQVILVFVGAIFLTKYFPIIISEDIDKKNMGLKLTALIFMICGILILALG